MTSSKLALTALALTSTLAACRDATGPEAELTQRLESEHYVYRFSPGDAVDTLWQETYHGWLLTELGIESTPKIEFYKYGDRAQIERLTGENTNGFAEVGTYRFHTISPIDNHEVVHAIASAEFGLPPALINEGFAVAHQTAPLRGIYEPHWGPTPVHDLALEYLDAGELPPLDRLLESRGFFDFDIEITYPVAGSFVRYLIDTGHLEDLKELMGRSTFEDQPAELRDNFQAEFGESIDDAWARWLAFLPSRG